MLSADGNVSDPYTPSSTHLSLESSPPLNMKPMRKPFITALELSHEGSGDDASERADVVDEDWLLKDSGTTASGAEGMLSELRSVEHHFGDDDSASQRPTTTRGMSASDESSISVRSPGAETAGSTVGE